MAIEVKVINLSRRSSKPLLTTINLKEGRPLGFDCQVVVRIDKTLVGVKST
jgi:hypothetical protein